MKSTLRVSLLVALALAVAAGPVFGQFTPKKVWTLTVTVNAPNAVVYVDNVLAPGGTAKVTGGAHNVKVHADGWFDFNGPVVVSGDMTFPVTLVPQGYPLTIRVSVPGARVFVDDAEVTGTVPLVTPGTHVVQVTAPGFVTYNATINVAAPMSLDVAMQPGLSLMVTVNVPNASISVDGVPIQGNVAFVSRGPHRLNVRAEGYLDWNGMVNVTNNMTLPVRMSPAGFPITVRVNVPNASIFIDGVNVTGTGRAVTSGSHTIRVTAPGYQEYNTAVTVTGPLTLDVVLQPAGFLLTVNANVADATVTVNNAPKGQVPYSEYLPPGTYSVRVSAYGYTDYAANIPLNKAVNLVVQLTPSVSTLSVVIPPAFSDPESQQGDRRGQVRIFIDNRLANPNRELDRIPIAPGRHSVRITSGAFSVQAADLVVQPGLSYVLELSLGVNTRTSPSGQ